MLNSAHSTFMYIFVLLLKGKDPEVICASSEYKELKWIAGTSFFFGTILYKIPDETISELTTVHCVSLVTGVFYWIESVQTYNEGGWDYINELQKFVTGGMTGTAFIDGVSGIVNRGCHNPVS